MTMTTMTPDQLAEQPRMDAERQDRMDRLARAMRLGAVYAEQQYDHHGVRQIELLDPLVAETRVAGLILGRDERSTVARSIGGDIALPRLTYEFWLGYQSRLSELLARPECIA